MDNSPRWDRAYANVVPGDLPPYERADLLVVSDPSQRPSDREYDRYLWLVEQMRRAGYDDYQLASTMSFAVEDVFVTAIFALACEVLANIGEEYKQPHADVRELYSWAERFRAGVVATTDARTGAARDFDVRLERWINTETLSMFAPLLCGGLPRDTERSLLRLFEGPRFCGHPDLRYALPPSTSPVSKDFRSREYWRGPVWPVMSWLFSDAAGPNAPSCCAPKVCAKPATAASPNTTNPSPANPWAACSSPGPRPRSWTGSADASR
jgi:hypothetical protein